MRSSLADNLNLCGTARYNLDIRHKLSLGGGCAVASDNRKKTPAFWEIVTPYLNHSELSYINELARKAGVHTKPFPNAEVLPADNGERFFLSSSLKLIQSDRPTMSTTNAFVRVAVH